MQIKLSLHRSRDAALVHYFESVPHGLRAVVLKTVLYELLQAGRLPDAQPLRHFVAGLRGSCHPLPESAPAQSATNAPTASHTPPPAAGGDVLQRLQRLNRFG
ncbi:MAG: hypothetical protein N2690_00130 [Rhodocyclaceae bacterium]|nr:hypothetical protein [Rhodocyclaceae bacterium]